METIEHEIIIDDNILVKLKIPKVLTAMELKALSMKADKMFKLSDAVMPPTAHKGRPSKSVASLFTDEMGYDIVMMRDEEQLPYEAIASRINAKYDKMFTKDNVQAKYYNQKTKQKNGVQTKGINSTLWNEEKLEYLKKLINSHVSYKVKAERMNKKFNTDFTSKAIQKKFYNLKQNNKWDSIRVSQDE